MKHIVLVGDGMADFPLPEHGGLTPLEMARTPVMDKVVRCGVSGLFCPIPDDLEPGSDIGNISLFGYDPHTTYTGRAPLEAASRGIHIDKGQVAFRCNLVTLEDGLMRDFTAGHITSEEAVLLIDALNEAMGKDEDITFHSGVGYRHLTIFSSVDPQIDGFARLVCTPPHDITGQPFEPHLPDGPGGERVRKVMQRARLILSKHQVNAVRDAVGDPPANAIWLWGQGRAPSLEPFQERFGIAGAVVSAVDLVNGIGVLAGLKRLNVPGATGYLDTDYAGKVDTALRALDKHDFVFVHVEATDETSHEGRLDRKILAIEEFDSQVVGPCMQYLARDPECRLLVAPDHVTALSTRTHAKGPVPFAVCGKGVEAGRAEAFNESAATATGLLIREGHRLVPILLESLNISSDILYNKTQAGNADAR